MKVRACTEFDSEGSCIAEAWVDFGTALFGLSDSEMVTAVGAIAGLWVLAYLFKVAIRQVRYS